jgi:hypothetical protein
MRRRRDDKTARRLDMSVDVRLPTSDSRHEEADLLRIGSARGQTAYYAPLEENRDPV